MSKTLNAFLAGVAVGYWFGTRPREQAFAEAKQAADTARHVAESAVGFTKEKVADVREARAAHAEDAWQDAAAEPLAATDDYDLADDMSATSFPSSEAPSTWAGSDPGTSFSHN